MVAWNPSQTEQVQFAAVMPPRRMSANTSGPQFGDDQAVENDQLVVQPGHGPSPVD